VGSARQIVVLLPGRLGGAHGATSAALDEASSTSIFLTHA
jgi:hypothetical protein